MEGLCYVAEGSPGSGYCVLDDRHYMRRSDWELDLDVYTRYT
jgi:hypothetical protein